MCRSRFSFSNGLVFEGWYELVPETPTRRKSVKKTKQENRVSQLVALLRKEFRVAPEAWIAKERLEKIVEQAYQFEIARRRDYPGKIGL